MEVKLVNENFKNNYIENLLRARGVQNIEDFLAADESEIQSWDKLDNMELAVNLTYGYLKNYDNLKISTIVDCDQDGYASAAILINYLKQVKPTVEINTYFHEHKQHGFEDLWENMTNDGADLIIVADAASNDGEFIKEFNCPVIVLDHHEKEEKSITPNNMILVNNQISPHYKNKSLSGAGVAWQFCRGLDSVFKINYADDLIDLCALGVCGDVMSGLEIENQAIWKKGFNHIKNYGLLKFVDAQVYSMNGKINPTTIAFYIVPLVNATIRVGSMSEKERLFKAFVNGHELVPSNKRGEKGLMTEVANEAVREANNNRNKQNKVLDSAVDQMEIKICKYDLLEHKILFIRLEDEEFPSELNGLLAMRLAAKYKRPTIVARLNDEGFDRGSARTPSNSILTDFKGYLNETGLFEYANGHAGAFGCSLPDRNLTQFMKVADNDFKNAQFNNNVYEVNFIRGAVDKDIPELIAAIADYDAIWSTNNKEPLISITNLNFDKKQMQIMGKLNDTLKIEKNGVAYMKFHATDLINEINQMPSNEIQLNLVGRANMNCWMGHYTPQIFIDDYEIIDGRLAF